MDLSSLRNSALGRDTNVIFESSTGVQLEARLCHYAALAIASKKWAALIALNNEQDGDQPKPAGAPTFRLSIKMLDTCHNARVVAQAFADAIYDLSALEAQSVLVLADVISLAHLEELNPQLLHAMVDKLLLADWGDDYQVVATVIGKLQLVQDDVGGLTKGLHDKVVELFNCEEAWSNGLATDTRHMQLLAALPPHLQDAVIGSNLRAIYRVSISKNTVVKPLRQRFMPTTCEQARYLLGKHESGNAYKYLCTRYRDLDKLVADEDQLSELADMLEDPAHGVTRQHVDKFIRFKNVVFKGNRIAALVALRERCIRYDRTARKWFAYSMCDLSQLFPLDKQSSTDLTKLRDMAKLSSDASCVMDALIERVKEAEELEEAIMPKRRRVD